MTRVRVTMHPDKEYDVGPQEFADLQRQGLLVGVQKQKVDTTGTNVSLDTKES